MFPAKGSLLILDHRINNPVINRCRKPADADILVPGDTISLIGTTSMHIPYDEIDDNRVTAAEVDTLLREGKSWRRSWAAPGSSAPTPASARWWPAITIPAGRSVSRGIVLLDHAQRDGMEGFITITGGKLMTYRLMAEWATDAVCRKLGNTTPVPRPKPAARFTGANGKYPAKDYLPPRRCAVPAVYRHGDRTPSRLGDSRQHRSLVCECEAVTAGEVKYAVENLAVNTLLDLRRRTRIGMGTCQGNSAPAALPDCCSALTSPRPRSR